MSARKSSTRVPTHLVGTRQGLFHVLRDTKSLSQDDPMARAELPNAAEFEHLVQNHDAMRNTPVFAKSERDRVAAFLNKDEFCFNF